MSLLFPAIMCGIFCYLGSVESFPLLGVTGGYYLVSRPLIAGFLCGLVFGDVQSGILCGLAVQAVFIAVMSTGGATNSELTYAAFGGIGLAMATTKDPSVAVTLAILIGSTFGLVFYNTRMAAFAIFNEGAQAAAERGDDHGIFMWHVVYPNIVAFLYRALPVTLAIYFGQGFVDSVLLAMPDSVTHAVGVVSGVLPAVGIAMLMSIVLKNKADLIYFFFGFALMRLAGFSMIAIVAVSACVAYLVYQFSGRGEAPAPAAEAAPQLSDAAYEDADLF